jgi:hypothetical protein
MIPEKELVIGSHECLKRREIRGSDQRIPGLRGFETP